MKPDLNKTALIVFDRDGTIIKHVPYLSDPNLVELLPDVKYVLNSLKSDGHKLFLHTNQSGVERGFYSLNDVNLCNNRMLELLEDRNIFDRICIAPNLNPNILQNYRKPSRLFGLELLNESNYKQKTLIYVGDSLCDIETAVNLNCYAILISAPKRSENKEVESFVMNYKKGFVVKDFLQLKKIIDGICI